MPESIEHIQLVERIVRYIAREYGSSRSVVVFHDLSGPLGGERPPRIAGFVPDVYATDAPTSITILGEAKTAEDLDTDHSRQQIAAFLEYLRCRQEGVFILSVPWQLSAAAKNLLAAKTQDSAFPTTTVVILDGVRDSC